MAATKLRIYGDALRLLAEARLALITDDIEARYALDDAWTEAVEFVLGQAPWRFALVTAILAADASAIPGYTIGYAYPADWLRTHAIYRAVSGRQFPIDLREQGAHILTNNVDLTNHAEQLVMRYIANTYADPAVAPWPEHFAQCVAAYLAFLVAERVTGDRSAPSMMSKLFASLLPEAVAIDAIEEDPWLPHQRDGSFLRVARSMGDQGFWHFAMVTVQITTGISGDGLGGGFSRQATIDPDVARTRGLYVLTSDVAPTGAGERRPFKVREHANAWYTDETTFYAEYLSFVKLMDPLLWPDHYMSAVLRALHFDKATRGDDKDQKDDLAVYKDTLSDALVSEAVPADPWLEYQQSGEFDTAARAVLSRGYWWWGLKSLDIDSSTQESLSPQAGFPYRYALPSDWLRTHALFVGWDGHECPINIRQTNQDWSTDAAAWTARYLSTDVLDAKTWPEQVAAAVLAYLDWRSEPSMPSEKEGAQEEQLDGAEFQRLLTDALAAYSRPEDEWLRFQLDGRYATAVKMVLEKARWRFAVKTVTLTDPNNTTGASILVGGSTGAVAGDPNAFSDGSVSPGYACRMPKPLDWLRTLRVYFSFADGYSAHWIDPDYRDELGAIHVNYNPVQMRYLSRIGLDSTQWPMNFREAVMAWLQYSEITGDPKMSAAAARKLEIFERQCREAETLDDERDVPRVISTGRFVSARYGRSPMAREEGWPRW